MEKKDRYLLWELCLTFLLLFLLIFLFGEILSTYKLYLIFGLVSGFCFSWFIRDRYNREIKFFISIGALGILGWIIYSILNSSFIYRDIILICIKGVFILEFIISFNAYPPPFLTYIQALSIPLFMSYPVFIKGNYNEISIILTIAYIITWLVIFKVKFYEFFNPPSEKNIKQHYSVSVSGIFFLIILISSWVFFANFPLGQSRKGGVFPEEGPGEESGMEKEYYDLQDKIQEGITGLVPKFNSTDDRHQTLYLLSLLIKESPYTMEVDKAELGLISRLKQPGTGLEKQDTEKWLNLLKNYVDKKISLNLKRNKDSITDILKKNPLGIKNRISILSRVNKMRYGNSYKNVSRYEKELKKNINESSLNADVKTDIKELARRLKEWKAFEIYRQRLGSLDKTIGSLEEEFRKEFVDFPYEAKQLEKPSDYKEMDKKLNNLKETGQFKNIIKEIEEIADLKSEMSLAQGNRNLKDKLEASNLSENNIMKLKEGADNITDAQDYRKLSKNSDELKEKAEEGQADISGELKDLLEAKAYSLIKETKNKVEDMLKENAMPETQRKDFLKEIDKLESTKNPEKLLSDTKKLEATVDKFLNQGFIFKEARDSLIKEIDQLKGLLVSQLEAKGMKSPKEGSLSDIQGKWEELIETLPLKEETKEVLRKLTEELSRTDTILGIENIKQAIDKELASLSKKGMKAEAERPKEAFGQLLQIRRMYVIDRTLSNFKKDIEKLNKIDPQAGRILEEHLRKIRNSSTDQEFQKRLIALKEYIDSKESEVQDMPQEYRQLDPWQIYIIPLRLVVPVDSFVPLKTVAVYNKIFIKEPDSELEWFSSDPNVAAVDEGGLVHSLSKGTAKINARYKGKDVEGAEVIVVDKITKGIDSEIKNYLIR